MKKDSKQRLIEVMTRLDKTFKPKLNENRTHDLIRSAKTLEELENTLREYSINKGDLMKIAYDGDTSNVDSALPMGIWSELEPHGGTYYFVMDYKNNKVGGELVHLGEKILGIETNWNEKIRDSSAGDSVNEMNIQEQQTRPLYDIAQEIYRDWKPVHPYAAPYLDAMSSLNSINDNYMFDSGRDIVARFLSNASQWKGENAKRIKMELKQMLGLKEDIYEMDLSTKDGKSVKVDIQNKREIYINDVPIDEILEVIGDVKAVGNFSGNEITLSKYFNWMINRPEGVSEETFQSNNLFRTNIELLSNEYDLYTSEDESRNHFDENNEQQVSESDGIGGTPINKYVMFSNNFSPNFISEVWADDENLAKHLQGKFSTYYEQHGARAVMNTFYINLDGGNQRKLEDWILTNYND